MKHENDVSMSALTWEGLASIPKFKRILRKLNFSAVLILAIGLALNRYVWPNYYLEAYAAGYVVLIFIVNYMYFVMMAYGFYNAVKEWCGFEDKKDEEFDVYLASMKVLDSDD
jgi:hypothetical protein